MPLLSWKKAPTNPNKHLLPEVRKGVVSRFLRGLWALRGFETAFVFFSKLPLIVYPYNL
jgi:hypothetical protein